MANKDATTLTTHVQEALTDSPGLVREIARAVLQEIPEIEMTEHVGARRHERAATRTELRNGPNPARS